MPHLGAKFTGLAFVHEGLRFGGVHPIAANRLEFMAASPGSDSEEGHHGQDQAI